MPVHGRLILTGITASANSIALSQSLSGGGTQNVTLNGAAVTGGVATFPLQVGVTITSAGNDSGLTFTITGTNYMGFSQSETLAGPNANTVQSVLYYKTVTSVTSSGNTVSAITIGNLGTASPWFPMNYNRFPVSSQICNLTPGAVLTYTVQFTGDDLQAVNGITTRNASTLAIAQNHSTLTSQTINNTGTLISGVCGVRIVTNAWTSGSVTMNVIESSATDG